MMRISVSDIDQLAYFRASQGESWEMSLDDLRRRLLRLEPPTDAMAAGAAFHSILEHVSAGNELAEVERDGFRFKFELDEMIALPKFREIKGTKEYIVNGTPVTVVGKVDAFNGWRVDDHKLTARMDAEKYASAFQWRAYLDIFECDRFQYNIFEASERGDTRVIYGYHVLPFSRYPALGDAVQRGITDFVEFVITYVPEYGQPLEHAA